MHNANPSAANLASIEYYLSNIATHAHCHWGSEPLAITRVQISKYSRNTHRRRMLSCLA